MNEKEWTSKLRDRMADYEESVPKGLWEQIEGALLEEHAVTNEPPVGNSPQRKARVVGWRQWSVAAAVASFLLLGGGYLYKYAQEQTSKVEQLSRKQQTEVKPLSEGSPEVASAAASSVQGDTHLSAGLSKLALVARNEVSVLTEKNHAEPLMSDTPPEVAPSSVSVEPESKTDENLREPLSDQMPVEKRNDDEEQRRLMRRDAAAYSASQRSLDTDENRFSYKSRRRSGEDHSFSATLYAQNMVGNGSMQRNPVLLNDPTNAMMYQTGRNPYANYANGLYFDYSKVNDDQYNTRRAPVFLYNYEEVTNHHQPLTFGLSVAWRLTRNLAVETGVTYTKLSSDFIKKMDRSQLVSEQQLHYVGIPLRASYELLQWHGLSLYGIAGGAVDFNVKARYATEGIEMDASKDRVLPSVDAALGVQYQVLPKVGVYAEPGVRHYFDNGSKVEHYFKEHPTNFNLQLGVRFDMK